MAKRPQQTQTPDSSTEEEFTEDQNTMDSEFDPSAVAEQERDGDEATPDETEGDETEALRAEIASLKDQLLRAMADAENIRNRARKERDEAVKYAGGGLAKDLLSVADNLRRALDSVPAGAAEENEHLKSLMTGVEMTEKSLLEAFEKNHIKRIDPVGERLNPHYHEAMVEVEDPNYPPGTISQVLEPGYILHDRLLRPARVAVSKGSSQNGPGGQVDTQA
ncbi:nucleotide exchange factor GrpE [Fodinicurvata halophila]|uniref:Protein GrpE n=1 Tax=Fodinicurvata halophila TaxID=1419723 RepID=A0ABV8UP78_9PROT